MASARSSSVQRARPSRRTRASGRHQQGFLLAGELALRSRARLLAQRPFQIAFHEAPLGPINGGAAHRHAAGNLLVAAAGIGRQQDLGSLELAGGSLALAQHRGEFIAFGLAQFDPITYIHLGLLVGGPDESTNELKIRRRSRPSAKLHRKARPVPGFHLRLLAHVSPSTRRNRHAAPLPRQSAVGSPDGRDARTKRPHPAPTGRPKKHRTPRRSARPAHPEMARNQPVIITVKRY